MSATCGTDDCIRYDISYWLSFDGISGSFDALCWIVATSAMASSISRRSCRDWPSGLAMYGTGFWPDRNSTPW
jgi:hypothetical protein